MASSIQAQAEIDEWLKTSVGLFMDGDRAHGYQCKDVADDYAAKLFGVKQGVALGYGNAKYGLELANKKYFDIIHNDPNKPNQLPQRGDVIVWEGTNTGALSDAGHIAVNMSANGKGATVVQQDGYLQIAAHVATLPWWSQGTGMVSGWLRPKVAMVKYSGADKRGYGPAPAPAVTPAKSYTLRTTHRSPNYTPASQAASVFGKSRRIVAITIHWWNTPALAGTHDGTRNYLSRAGGTSSAHAVISPGLVDEIVSPADVAWHAGSADGNVLSVGLELDPRSVDKVLPTVIAYCADLERRYGDLLYYGHRDWTTTQCPGDFYPHLQKIIGGVNAALKTPVLKEVTTTPMTTPAPKPAPATPAAPAWTTTDNAVIHDINGNKRRVRDVLAFRFGKYERGLDRLAKLEATVKAQQKQLDALTKEK